MHKNWSAQLIIIHAVCMQLCAYMPHVHGSYDRAVYKVNIHIHGHAWFSVLQVDMCILLILSLHINHACMQPCMIVGLNLCICYTEFVSIVCAKVHICMYCIIHYINIEYNNIIVYCTYISVN